MVSFSGKVVCRRDLIHFGLNHKLALDDFQRCPVILMHTDR